MIDHSYTTEIFKDEVPYSVRKDTKPLEVWAQEYDVKLRFTEIEDEGVLIEELNDEGRKVGKKFKVLKHTRERIGKFLLRPTLKQIDTLLDI